MSDDMVGCALGASRLWFTIGGGISNWVGRDFCVQVVPRPRWSG